MIKREKATNRVVTNTEEANMASILFQGFSPLPTEPWTAKVSTLPSGSIVYAGRMYRLGAETTDAGRVAYPHGFGHDDAAVSYTLDPTAIVEVVE